MTPVDIAVAVALVALIGAPALGSLPKFMPTLPKPAAKTESEEAWRQRWVATLIDLQTDLEERSQDEQVELCRNMIWQMLGGETGEDA